MAARSDRRVKKKAILLRPIFLIPLTLFIFLLALRYLFLLRPAWGEAWARVVFRGLARPLAAFSGLFPYSLTEMLILLGLPLLLYGLVWAFLRLFRIAGWRLRRFFRACVSFLSFILMLLVSFMLFHGLNYQREALENSLKLEIKARDTRELLTVAEQLLDTMLSLRDGLSEDEHGVLGWSGRRVDLYRQSYVGYETATKKLPFLANGVVARPKGILLSPLWSRLGIAGIYSPFLVEAHVNQAQPVSGILHSCLHELAHVQGFAREEDAEFLAYLSGEAHPQAIFRYAAALSAWQSVSAALQSADRALWEAHCSRLSPAIRRDIAAVNQYWASQKGRAEEISRKVNDHFLKANLQESGVKSYGRVVDLLLAWFSRSGGGSRQSYHLPPGHARPPRS